MQIASHLEAARRALDEGRYEAVIESADRAAVLDRDDVRAHELIEQARAAIDERQLHVWVDEAHQAIGRGALADASRLAAQALKLTPSNARSAQTGVEDRARARACGGGGRALTGGG